MLGMDDVSKEVKNELVRMWKEMVVGSCKLTDPPHLREENLEVTQVNFFFISVFNQLDAQNLFRIKIYFIPLHVSSTCAHHQEVKIALHSLWYHHTYRCDDTRGCVMQFRIKFYCIPVHVSSTCAHHQEVKIALYSL